MKIRLGPLPRTDTVKMVVNLPVSLKSKLDQYAQLHSSTWNEPVDAAALVPHMLQQFIERDRGFKAALKRGQGMPSASPTDG